MLKQRLLKLDPKHHDVPLLLQLILVCSKAATLVCELNYSRINNDFIIGRILRLFIIGANLWDVDCVWRDLTTAF